MGTHPIFESDFDCLTVQIENTQKMSMLGGAPDMSPEQVQQAQNQQMKDFLSTYNKTTQICFNDCVKNFSTAVLTTDEEECGRKCVGKYLEYSARVAQQFVGRNSQ